MGYLKGNYPLDVIIDEAPPTKLDEQRREFERRCTDVQRMNVGLAGSCPYVDIAHLTRPDGKFIWQGDGA